jgi:hypothetical protein
MRFDARMNLEAAVKRIYPDHDIASLSNEDLIMAALTAKLTRYLPL